MTISEVAKRSGLPSLTVRFYESNKLILRTRCTSRRRDYDDEVFADLQMIRMALDAGFILRQARALIHGFSAISSPSKRWQALATDKLAEIRLHMTHLLHAEKLLERATRCLCISLANCLDLFLRRDQAVSGPMKSGCIRY